MPWRKLIRDRQKLAFWRPNCLSPPGVLPKSRLLGLDIAHWTNVTISNDHATAAIILYLETEHSTMPLFDEHLFIDDLVNKRHRFCSSMLVNALLCYATVYANHKFAVSLNRTNRHHSTHMHSWSRLWLPSVLPSSSKRNAYGRMSNRIP